MIKHNTAKHHTQSVKVKMALTEDLKQKQHIFGECTLYVSYCPCFWYKETQILGNRVLGLVKLHLGLDFGLWTQS